MPNNIVPPGLDDVLNIYIDKISSQINSVEIGRIEKVNDNETVEIQLQIKRFVTDERTVTIPLLVDCPYFVLSGGSSYIDMPIIKGDYCIVLFNDRNIDAWWKSGAVTDPEDKRKHSLSDGIALVGISPNTNFFELSGDAIGIRGANKKVRVDNNFETLLTLTEDLIDTVSNLITVGSATTQALDPATKAALAVIKTRFGTLLEA